MTASKSDYGQLAAKTPESVRQVLRRLSGAGYQAWLAGGCVRDLILGREPGDFDITTSASPTTVQSLFRRTIPTGIQHGTVTVIVDDPSIRSVEVTTFRGEGEYLDGRRPESVEFLSEGKPGDLERDLARRDFTINAMAFDPESAELRDPNGGLADLQLKRVRCVGDALARFSEDGLRPLRAVRFCSILEFDLDRATHDAIPASVATFRKVAGERVRDELNKLLVKSPRPSRGLRLLAETGLLAEILPELVGQGATDWEHRVRTVDATPAGLVVRLAALLHDDTDAKTASYVAVDVLNRLRHPRRIVDSVSHLVRIHSIEYRSELGDGEVRRLLAKIGPDELPAFFALREAEVRAKGSDSKEVAGFRSRLDAQIQNQAPLFVGDLAITGDDLVASLGRTPGPWVGQTLRALLEHVLDDPRKNARERLLAIAAAMP